MSAILHVLRAVMESDTSEFGKNIKAAAEGTQKLGKAWDDTAKMVGQAADKVDKAAQRAAREAERLAQKAAKAQEKAAKEAARAQEKAAREVLRAQEKAAREAQRLARETARIQERAAAQAARAQEKAAREAAKAAREAARAAEKAARDAAKAARDMGQAWLSAAQAIDRAAMRVVTVIGGAATGIAGFVGKIGLEFNAMQERSTIAFTTLLESAQKAREFMGDLRDFAKKTPFELPGLIQAAQKMLAMGFAAGEILPTLTAVGDAAAGLGGSQETLERITRALGQMKAKGKVQAEEMLQLAEAGVPAWQFLADFLQTDIPTAMAMVTDGAVTASQGIEAIVGGMQRKFGGLMVEQSTTFTGLISNLKDTLNQAAGQVMEPAFERIKQSMKGLLDAIAGPEFEAAIGRVGRKVAEVVEQISRSFSGISAGDVIGRLESAISGAIKMFGQLVVAAREVGPPLIQLTSEFAKFLGVVLRFVTEHPLLLKALVALKVAGFLGLTGAVTSLGAALIKTIASLVAFRTAAAAAGTTAATAKVSLAALFGPAGLLIAGVGGGAIWAISVLENIKTQLRESAKEAEALEKHLKRLSQQNVDFVESRIEQAKKGNNPLGGIAEQANRAFREHEFSVANNLPRNVQVNKSREVQFAIKELRDHAFDLIRKAVDARDPAARDQLGQMKSLMAGLGAGKLTPDEFAKAANTLIEGTKQAAEEFRKRMEPTFQKMREKDRTDAVKQTIEAQQREQRRGELPEFERVSGLLNQPDVDARAAKLIGASVEGATPESLKTLVDQFHALKQAGKLTKDNIDQIVETFLTTVRDAKAKTEQAKTEAEQVRSATIGFQDDIATSEASDQQKSAIFEKSLGLEEDFLAGDITLDIFRQKLAALREELQAGIAAAEKKAADEQKLQNAAQAELNKFNARIEQFARFLPTARLAKTRELAQKLAEAFKKGEITIEQLRVKLGALGKSALDTAKNINESIENMLRRAFSVRRRQRNRGGIGTGFATSFQGDDGPGFQNQVPDPSAGWLQFVGFMNTTAGMIASVQNQIALLQQNLQVLDRARDRIRVEEQIAGLMQTLNQLLTPAPSLVTGVNPLSGIFFDPGLTGAASGPGGPGKSFTLNFHSLTRPTPEDARILVDTFEEELARRGWR